MRLGKFRVKTRNNGDLEKILIIPFLTQLLLA